MISACVVIFRAWIPSFANTFLEMSNAFNFSRELDVKLLKI